MNRFYAPLWGVWFGIEKERASEILQSGILTLSFFAWKGCFWGKTHNEQRQNFIVYGKLYTSCGITGISDKIVKNVNKIAKKR